MRHSNNRNGFMLTEVIVGIALLGIFGSSMFLMQTQIMQRAQKTVRGASHLLYENNLCIVDRLLYGQDPKKSELYTSIFKDMQYTRVQKEVTEKKQDTDVLQYPHLQIVTLQSKEASFNGLSEQYLMYQRPVDSGEQHDA